MVKWADFVISQVCYDSNHLISRATRHKDSDKGIDEGKIIDRLTIASDIKNGLVYITVYSGISSWKRGHKIHVFRINGQPYIRIDDNKVKFDNLGDLPEVTPLVYSENTEPVEDDEATPEQLARLQQLENQIRELESQKPSSPRGSLPKESAEELPQELDLAPEPVEDDEATPEQLQKLTDLQNQINELESILSSSQFNSKNETIEKLEDDEATPEQLQKLTDLQNQINELENILNQKQSYNSLNKQFEQINELEKEIEKFEAADIEHEIIQTLKKHNQKLDDIENKIHQIIPKNTTKSFVLDAYCVRCKTKRLINNPEETLMKNGRSAIRGTCSVCNCKVFRIGKIPPNL